MSASATRHPLPDALRALALVGVLAVNAIGYAGAPWGPLMGQAVPEGDGLALLLQGLQAACMQGKAYPLLAMLFGAGLFWALRGRGDAGFERSRTRLRRMLLLGVLHGLLLYFGDILTMYALAGLLVLSHVQRPWASLRRTLRRAWYWAVLVTVLVVSFSVMLDLHVRHEPTPPDTTLLSVSSWPAFWQHNAGAYLAFSLTGLLLGLPLIRALLLTGVAAARLRWLTHPRWRPQRRWWVRRALAPLLVLNLAYGIGMVWVSNASAQRLGWLESAGPLICIPLSICLAAAAAEHWLAGHRGWAERLAPLGQRTLSLYVFHAIWCVALFSGVGLAWQPSTAVLLVLTLLLWWSAWQLALRSRGPWPLESWMGRPS